MTKASDLDNQARKTLEYVIFIIAQGKSFERTVSIEMNEK